MTDALTSAISEDEGKVVEDDVVSLDDQVDAQAASDEASDEGSEQVVDDTPVAQDGREKDPVTGKFVAKSKTQAQDASAASGKTGPTDAALATLSKEAAALWPTLPPVMKEEMNRLARERTSFVQAAQRELADYKKDHAAIDPVLKPFDDLCKSKGLHTPQMLHSYIEWSKLAETNPQQFLQSYCQRMGLDLRKMLEGPAQDELDPVVRNLQQKTDQAVQRVDQFLGSIQQREQQQAMASLQSFREATDAQGNLMRPHYDKVVPVMNTLYAQARQRMPNASADQVLQTCYDMACRADPDIYREIAQAQFNTEQSAASQAAAARSAKARGASVSPAGAPAPTGGPSMGGKSIKELLEAQMANVDRIT